MGIKGGHHGYCVKDGGLWCRIGTERYRVFGNSRIHIALCVVQYIINYYGHTCGHQDCITECHFIHNQGETSPIKHITRHTQLAPGASVLQAWQAM